MHHRRGSTLQAHLAHRTADGDACARVPAPARNGNTQHNTREPHRRHGRLLLVGERSRARPMSGAPVYKGAGARRPEKNRKMS